VFHYTRLESLSEEKHSSLLGYSKVTGKMKFCKNGTLSLYYRLFMDLIVLVS
jgi:hypothetical protein